MSNITLDTDELGIWLVDETPEGPQQMGHISWREIARGVQSEVDAVREENMRLREDLRWVANECGYASGTENIRKVAFAALAKEGE